MNGAHVELDEVAALVGREDVVILDVRTREEYDGSSGAPCDPRQGHIPGARNVNVLDLAAAATAEEVRALVAAPPGAEIVAYCHSGSRSEVAAQILRAVGYPARNYLGSWHEWSRRANLPIEADEPLR